MRRLSSLVLAGLLSLSSCSTTNFRRDLPESDRPYKQVETLQVNKFNRYRHFAFKSEEEGIADLGNLVSNEIYEEEYVFVPGMNPWIEIGKEEDTEVAYDGDLPYHLSSVSVDERFLNGLFRRYKKLNFYHFHPNKSKLVTNAQTKRFHSYVPSDKDFFAMLLLSREFYNNSGEEMRHKLVSRVKSLRVTEYFVLDDAKEALKELDLRSLDDTVNYYAPSFSSYSLQVSESFGRMDPKGIESLADDCIGINLIEVEEKN